MTGKEFWDELEAHEKLHPVHALKFIGQAWRLKPECEWRIAITTAAIS